MIKNSQKQTGSTHVVIIVLLVIALISTLGIVFYQNFINKDSSTKDSARDTQLVEDDKNVPSETPKYTLDSAVSGINEALAKNGCSGNGMSRTITKDAFEEVEDSIPYSYKAGVSKINAGLSYAFVQYGCGSHGSVALLKKPNDEWVLVSEDARIHPMCENVRGQGFPISIIDKCYVDDHATEPVAI